MPILDTRLKLISVAITILWSVVSLGIFSFSLSRKRTNTRKLHIVQILSQALFVIWALLPYEYIFDLSSFKADVKQLVADYGQIHKYSSRCPQFESQRWSQFAGPGFASVMVILSVIYLTYLNLFRNVHWSLESLYEHRRQARVRESSYEADFGFECPGKKKVTKGKRVTFQIPEHRRLSSSFLSNVSHEVWHFVLAQKRQVITSMVCLVLSTILLPKAAYHAFPMHLIKIGTFEFTSDHVIFAVMIFTAFDLGRIVSSNVNPSMGTCDFRVAVTSFIQFYGIFLLLSCALVFSQVNDTLKLYIYKLFVRCGSTRNWRTFFDVRVPNENLLSTILGENMMKYTNGVLSDEFSQQKTMEVIDDAISLFIWAYGDCVTVFLFANLVFVPGSLVLTCSN